MTASQISLVEQLQHENQFFQNKVTILQEQLDWFQRQLFGKRSERIASDLNSEQLTFEGFDNLQTTKEEQKKNRSCSYQA